MPSIRCRFPTAGLLVHHVPPARHPRGPSISSTQLMLLCIIAIHLLCFLAAPVMPRSIKTILPAPRPHWVGNGFHVFPVFNQLAFTAELSPFLMLDYAAPKQFDATAERRGVGQHPHRGFETVTIAFQGEVEHGDSLGNRDVIGTGDVQWMTAGRGIIHEEFQSTAFSKRGGTFEMIQLWVNLPAAHKMTAPKYQAILAKQIPQVPLANDCYVSSLQPQPRSGIAEQSADCSLQCVRAQWLEHCTMEYSMYELNAQCRVVQVQKSHAGVH